MNLKLNANYSKMRNSELADEFMKWISDIENERVSDTRQNCQMFMSLCQTIAARLRSMDGYRSPESKNFKKPFERRVFGKRIPAKHPVHSNHGTRD